MSYESSTPAQRLTIELMRTSWFVWWWWCGRKKNHAEHPKITGFSQHMCPVGVAKSCALLQVIPKDSLITLPCPSRSPAARLDFAFDPGPLICHMVAFAAGFRIVFDAVENGARLR